MDPRFLRSRRSLRAAALEAAAAHPLSSLTVAELCRAAGVTRDTFYRHAASPEALVADILGEEVRELTEAVQDPSGGVLIPDGFRDAENALLAHVASRADVYRNAMEPVLPALLRFNIERVMRDGLVGHLRHHPESLPDGVDASDLAELTVIAGYSATGTLGAIEAWLEGDDLNVDRGVRLILAASPAFWFASTTQG